MLRAFAVSSLVACMVGHAFWFAPRAVTPRGNDDTDRAASVGDIVFIRTTTWRGRFVRLLELGNDDFAHVGVIVRAAPDLEIVHASPTESGTVRVDRLSTLLARSEATSFAIYHPRSSPSEATRAAAIALKYAADHTPFDTRFDLAEDRAVYCTELVWLAYRGAGLRIESLSDILFPSDLIQSGFFEIGPSRS